MKHDRTYGDYVAEIQEKTGMQRQEIADFIGIDPSVLSKRIAGRDVRHEGMVVISMLRDLLCTNRTPGSRRHAEEMFAENPFMRRALRLHAERKAAA